MSDVTLAARVHRLEARAEISDLVSRYARVVDEGDLAALAELFTADAVLTTGTGQTVGRDAIVAFFAARLDSRSMSFHTPHGFELSFDGDDTAHGLVSGHAEQVRAGVFHAIGLRYTDRYALVAGRWRFAARQIAFVYQQPLAEPPGSSPLSVQQASSEPPP